MELSSHKLVGTFAFAATGMCWLMAGKYLVCEQVMQCCRDHAEKYCPTSFTLYVSFSLAGCRIKEDSKWPIWCVSFNTSHRNYERMFATCGGGWVRQLLVAYGLQQSAHPVTDFLRLPPVTACLWLLGRRTDIVALLVKPCVQWPP